MDIDTNFIHTKQGWCYWTLNPTPFIYGLFIKKQYRNQGYAHVLLQMVIREIYRSAKHCDVIEIEANPKEPGIDRARLIRLYNSVGLSVIDKRSV